MKYLKSTWNGNCNLLFSPIFTFPSETDCWKILDSILSSILCFVFC